MSKDPMDAQLVEAVLAAPTRRRRAAAAEVKAVSAATRSSLALPVVEDDDDALNDDSADFAPPADAELAGDDVDLPSDAEGAIPAELVAECAKKHFPGFVE